MSNALRACSVAGLSCLLLLSAQQARAEAIHGMSGVLNVYGS